MSAWVALAVIVAMPPPHDEGSGITCADCHQPHVITSEYDVQVMCQSCHNPTGMASSMSNVSVHVTAGGTVIGCGKCHDPHNLELSSGRGAGLIRETIRWPSAQTPVTYPASSNALVAGVAPYDGICEVCHTQTAHHRNDASGDHAHQAGASCQSCHPHARGFGFDHAGAILPVPACAVCHAGSDSIADVHAGDCALCHLDPAGGGPLLEPWETTQPNGGDCADCHSQVSGDHQEISHQATPGNGTVILFADDGHDDAGWSGPRPYFDVFVGCGQCHTADLLAAHADRCVTCHPTPVATLAAWTGGCQEGGCHPVIHADSIAAHLPFDDPYDPGNDCDRCHQPGVGPVVPGKCFNCHANIGGGDTTPPVTTSDAQASYTGAAWIDFVLTDNGEVGVGTTFYRVDGGALEVGSRVLVSPSGVHTLEFWSVDQAGNVESPANAATFTIVADTTAPVTTANAQASYYQGAVITLFATDASSFGVKATHYSLDGGPTQTGTRVVVPGVTGVISYTLHFWSEDWSGNVEAPNSASFTVTSGTATVRLVWSDSDISGPPTHPDASAYWFIRRGGASGPLVVSGSGANPGWSGVDDEVVPVSGAPYYVDIWWWDTTWGWDDNTVYPDIYLTTPGELVRLSY